MCQSKVMQVNPYHKLSSYIKIKINPSDWKIISYMSGIIVSHSRDLQTFTLKFFFHTIIYCFKLSHKTSLKVLYFKPPLLYSELSLDYIAIKITAFVTLVCLMSFCTMKANLFWNFAPRVSMSDNVTFLK